MDFMRIRLFVDDQRIQLPHCSRQEERNFDLRSRVRRQESPCELVWTYFPSNIKTIPLPNISFARLAVIKYATKNVFIGECVCGIAMSSRNLRPMSRTLIQSIQMAQQIHWGNSTKCTYHNSASTCRPSLGFPDIVPIRVRALKRSDHCLSRSKIVFVRNKDVI